MQTIVLDFETYFDKDITLQKLNYSEYVPKAEPQLVGYILNSQLICVSGEAIKEHLDAIDWTQTALVGHNLLFDALVLKHWYGHEPAQYIDTLGMVRLLHPSIDHSLENLAERFCPQLYKNTTALKSAKGKRFNELNDDEQTDFISYCKTDVLITAKLYDLFKIDFPQFELDLIDHTIRLWVNPTLVLDVEKATAAVEQEKQEIQKLLQKWEVSKEDIRSDTKFIKYLAERHDINNPPMKWSNKKNCEIPAFAKNDSQFGEFYKQHPELQELLDLKRSVNSSIRESRTNRLIVAANLNNGCIPVGYNYYGAFTGRFSGTNKVNLQNLPRGSILRDALMAPDGYLLAVSDLSQIEARVLAWLAGEQQILDVFTNKGDLYCEAASAIFGFAVNKKDHPDERFVGKSSILGLGYGMSAPKFQIYCSLQGRKLTEDFCYNVVETYRKTYFRIPALWKLIQEHIHILASFQKTKVHPKLTFDNDKILLPSGRALKYEGLHYDDHEQSWRLVNGKRIYGALIVENLVQAISRDILCEQLLKIHQTYPIVMHTHDELITCVPQDQANEALDYMLNVMSTPPAWASDLPISAEGAIGKRYGDCK